MHRLSHIAHDRLPTIVDRHILHRRPPREAVRGGGAASPAALVDAQCPPMAVLSEPAPAPIPFKRRMTGNYLRNTGPMLASFRCGAKTRSGKACRSPA